MLDNQKILAPGQRLLLLMPETTGARVTYQEYSYDDLIALVASKRSRSSKSRLSKTPATKASRTIGLLGRAIVSGKWSTGATIDRGDAFDRLINVVTALGDTSLLTDNAKGVIGALAHLRSDIPNLAARQASLQAAYSGGLE